MKAIIVVNAYTRSPAELARASRIREELERLGVQAEILKNRPSLVGEKADFCVYFDKDKYMARMLGARMRLFNRAEAIELCDDKMLTYLALEGLPMPKTVSSLLCYSEPPEDDPLLDGLGLGYPVVVKENFGSLGGQVYLARTRQELEELHRRLIAKPHLFQRFVSESAGRDLRIVVVGGKTVAAMTRTSEGDFRSNLACGGRGEAAAPDAEARALAEEAARRLGLDYCGVDLLFGREGYLLCEVNSNAFFGGIEAVTGIDVARAYAEHIVREMGKNA